LFTLRSPIAAALVPINQHSANAVADQLFLAVGARVSGSGTREAGARATARALEALGVSSSGLVQVDGSGLSRANRVTAEQVSALIAAVITGEPAGSRSWLDSLAVAGESGTLAERMLDSPARGRVRAKTGWIRGTTGLAGVAETLAGDRLVFALLIEYPAELGGLNTHAFKPMGDAVARVLVEYGI